MPYTLAPLRMMGNLFLLFFVMLFYTAGLLLCVFGPVLLQKTSLFSDLALARTEFAKSCSVFGAKTWSNITINPFIAFNIKSHPYAAERRARKRG
jgi:hypothetical protein